MILFILFVMVALLVVYFVFLRKHLEQVSWFAPVYVKLDAFYAMLFDKSRTLVMTRGLALVGYVLAIWDNVLPILSDLTGAGLFDPDNGMLPAGAKWIGPMLILIGHMGTFLRKDTTGPVGGTPNA